MSLHGNLFDGARSAAHVTGMLRKSEIAEKSLRNLSGADTKNGSTAKYD